VIRGLVQPVDPLSGRRHLCHYAGARRGRRADQTLWAIRPDYTRGEPLRRAVQGIVLVKPMRIEYSVTQDLGSVIFVVWHEAAAFPVIAEEVREFRQVPTGRGRQIDSLLIQTETRSPEARPVG